MTSSNLLIAFSQKVFEFRIRHPDRKILFAGLWSCRRTDGEWLLLVIIQGIKEIEMTDSLVSYSISTSMTLPMMSISYLQEPYELIIEYFNI